MQASEVVLRAGCSAEELQRLVRDGVVVPPQALRGSGNHVQYDDANLVVVALAAVLKNQGVKVKALRAGLVQLQIELRGMSSIAWGNLVGALTASDVRLAAGVEKLDETGVAFIYVDLGRIATSLLPLPADPQLSLGFGMSSVG